jgi:hypothetical protein
VRESRRGFPWNQTGCEVTIKAGWWEHRSWLSSFYMCLKFFMLRRNEIKKHDSRKLKSACFIVIFINCACSILPLSFFILA